MDSHFVAYCSININAPLERVWQALVTPADIREYMFGATVTTDWVEGSRITWAGEWEGDAYEDRGTILQLEPGQTLKYTHFSPRAGLPDRLENYHTVTIQLSDDGPRTGVTLTQDNNPTAEAREHAEKNWETMLAALKRHVEMSGGPDATA